MTITTAFALAILSGLLSSALFIALDVWFHRPESLDTFDVPGTRLYPY